MIEERLFSHQHIVLRRHDDVTSTTFRQVAHLSSPVGSIPFSSSHLVNLQLLVPEGGSEL